MKSILFSIISIVSIISTIEAIPADLKEIQLNRRLHQKGVHASWGGYQASAGLGDGLYASAGTPYGQNANAGLLGGSGVFARSAASENDNVYYGTDNQRGGRPFDKVFAIPINVLHSVNDYVKTKDASRGVYGVHSVHSDDASVRFNAAEGSSAVSSAGNGEPIYAVRGQHKQRDYDKIFNIPITALKSVNDLLGGP